ncbi:MAG TPA: arsenate reductase (glutaredoxin) [Gammaproteobacteria bacterium]|nr:arsenate reductase (glutaredoxin) [Gammaproteobacteria bacterium]
MKVTIYHNPRCSKSRETLALLTARGIQPEIIEYLKTPPDQATLQRLLKALGMTPRQLLRTKEDAYAETGLDNPKLSDAQILKTMVTHPVLLERPIVVVDGKAAIGRPPENVLRLLK